MRIKETEFKVWEASNYENMLGYFTHGMKNNDLMIL